VSRAARCRSRGADIHAGRIPQTVQIHDRDADGAGVESPRGWAGEVRVIVRGGNGKHWCRPKLDGTLDYDPSLDSQVTGRGNLEAHNSLIALFRARGSKGSRLRCR